MFEVTLLHLTRDVRVATPDLGRDELGRVPREQLLVLLEAFRAIDPVQNHDARPRLLVRGPAGEVSVRTQKDRLFFDEPSGHGAESEGFEPWAMLEAIATGTAIAPTSMVRRGPRAHAVVAFAILAASAALDWHTFRRALEYPSVDPATTVQPIADVRDLAAVSSAVKGHYATGADEGDREIAIDGQGQVQFSRRSDHGLRVESDDRFRVGRSASGVCLATERSGVIEVTNIDVIAYSGDVYRRR